MANARKIIDTFLDGLSGAEAERLLVRLRGFSLLGPLTHQEYLALQSPSLQRPATAPKTKEQIAALDRHAEATAQLAITHEAWDIALRDLRVAERKRGPEQADGFRRRTSEQDHEVARLAEIVEERHDDLEAALTAEVDARPHQPGRRRARTAFPLAGIFARKTADYSSEHTGAEVRHG